MYRITKEFIEKCEDLNRQYSLDFSKIYVSKSNQRLKATCLNNHVIDVGLSEVIKGRFTCEDCLTDKYKEAAENLDFTFIERLKTRSSKLKCNKCSETIVRQNSSIIRSEVLCNGCTFEKYFNIAKTTDFNLIDIVRKNATNKLVLSCKNDGNILLVNATEFGKFKHFCNTCKENNYSEKLRAKGCEFLYQCGKLVHYLDSEGQKRTVLPGNLLNGEFAKSTDQSFWYQKTDVYFMHAVLDADSQFDNGLYFKIGISNDPEVRLKRLKLNISAEVKTVRSCYNMFEASQIEKWLHAVFNESRLNKTISSKLGSYFRKKSRYSAGYSEWFYLKGEDSMLPIVAICVISMSEILKAKEVDLDKLATSDNYFKEVLYSLGLDVSFPFDVKLLQHRNKFNEVVTCDRICGMERTDDSWISSGYASNEAKDKARNNKLLNDLYRLKGQVEV